MIHQITALQHIKKSGVSNDQNSDAIDKSVNYEEKDQVAAVTEEIVLSDTTNLI